MESQMTVSRYLRSCNTVPAFREFVQRLVLLSSCSLFSDLAAHAYVELAAHAQTRVFGSGDVLVKQGEPVNAIMVLQSGRVKETQQGSGGNEVLIRFTCTGEAVNLQAVTPPSEHTCSARATAMCTVLAWDTRTMERFLARYPKLNLNISRILTGRVQELEERFVEIVGEKVDCRLQLLLVRLARQIGETHRLGTQISLRRDELAQMIGTTVFTVCRLLSAWSTQGLVIPRKESVILRHVAPTYYAHFLLERGVSIGE